MDEDIDSIQMYYMYGNEYLAVYSNILLMLVTIMAVAVV